MKFSDEYQPKKRRKAEEKVVMTARVKKETKEYLKHHYTAGKVLDEYVDKIKEKEGNHMNEINVKVGDEFYDKERCEYFTITEITTGEKAVLYGVKYENAQSKFMYRQSFEKMIQSRVFISKEQKMRTEAKINGTYCSKHHIPCKFWGCYGCSSTDGCWKEYQEHMKKKDSDERSKD